MSSFNTSPHPSEMARDLPKAGPDCRHLNYGVGLLPPGLSEPPLRATEMAVEEGGGRTDLLTERIPSSGLCEILISSSEI